MGLSQRTINTTRFYKPALAKLTGRELMFAQKGLGEHYRLGYERSKPVFDFAAPGIEYPIMTRRVAKHYPKPGGFEPEYFGMGPFQITYNFSHAARKNNFPVKDALLLNPKAMKEYGASGWSFRMLYEFLCRTYNNNVPFIDTYFEKVFKTRPVHSRFLAIYDDIQDDINSEQFELFQSVPLKNDGTPDMRHAVSKKFMDFKVWQDPITRQGCKRIADEIRHDIEVCLSTGKLPLNGRHGASVSPGTEKVRREFAGFHPSRLFYASGQLIRHLNVFVEIGGNAA